jgi:transposase-like protein
MAEALRILFNEAMLIERENHLKAGAYERNAQGIRSERALNASIAEMYIQGASTRKVTHILESLCGLSVSSTQVSRANALLDTELTKWRNRPLGQLNIFFWMPLTRRCAKMLVYWIAQY